MKIIRGEGKIHTSTQQKYQVYNTMILFTQKTSDLLQPRFQTP